MNFSSEVNKCPEEPEHSLTKEEFNSKIPKASEGTEPKEHISTECKGEADSQSNHAMDVVETGRTPRTNTQELTFEYLNPLETSQNRGGVAEQSVKATKKSSIPQNSPNISPFSTEQSATERAEFIRELTGAMDLFRPMHGTSMNLLQSYNTEEAGSSSRNGIAAMVNPQDTLESNECELGTISEADTLPIDESDETWRNTWNPSSSDEESAKSGSKQGKRLCETARNDRIKLGQPCGESESSDDTSNLLLLASTAVSAKRKHLRSKIYNKESDLSLHPPMIDSSSQEEFNSASDRLEIQPDIPTFNNKLHNVQPREVRNSPTGTATKRKLFQEDVQSLIDDFSSTTLRDMKPIVYTDDSLDGSTQAAGSKKAEPFVGIVTAEELLPLIPKRFNIQQPSSSTLAGAGSSMKRSLSAENIGNLSKKSRNLALCERERDMTDFSKSSRRRKRESSGAYNLCTRRRNSSSPEIKRQRSGLKKNISEFDSLSD